jgi:hypothetical protein
MGANKVEEKSLGFIMHYCESGIKNRSGSESRIQDLTLTAVSTG